MAGTVGVCGDVLDNRCKIIEMMFLYNVLWQLFHLRPFTPDIVPRDTDVPVFAPAKQDMEQLPWSERIPADIGFVEYKLRGFLVRALQLGLQATDYSEYQGQVHAYRHVGVEVHASSMCLRVGVSSRTVSKEESK